MASELTLSASVTYADNEGADESLSVADLLATVSAKRYTKLKQNVGTAEEAVVLGEVTAPGWAMFINRDASNFINLKVATSGAVFAKLKPGEFALLRLGSGAQAPFAQADTAACQLETILIAT